MDSKGLFKQEKLFTLLSTSLLMAVILIYLVKNPVVAVEKLPVESFASLPLLQSVKLSPDGIHMACYMYVDQGEKSGFLVYIINLETGKKYGIVNLI